MSMDMDNLARQRIFTETDQNFFVEAGAGSGKTTQLVGRMAAMVANGIDISQICAITFTKPASREFYQRFQELLTQLSGNGETEEIRTRCRAALENIDLCFMGTIDSFAHLILHEHPAAAGIPSDSVVISNEQAAAAYRREYSRIAGGGYGRELAEKCELFRRFQDNPEWMFSDVIGKFMKLRSSRVVYDKPGSGDIDTLFAESRESLLRTLKKLMTRRENWCDLKTFAGKNEAMEKYFGLLCGSWNDRPGEIAAALKAIDGFRYVGEAEEIDAVGSDFFEERVIKKVRYQVLDISSSELVNYIFRLQYSATVDFLVSAADAIAEHMRETGELTFFDYKLYLRDMLRADASSGGRLIRHISSRHSYFLIDEFQDTDPMQSEIFFYLAAENPVPKWRECVPRPGSLFIVGDPKQSIYRFRGADVKAFSQVREIFRNGAGQVLELTRNYRSTPYLKNWFNHVFSQLLPEDTDDQPKFLNIPIDAQETPDNVLTGVWKYPVALDRTTLLDDSQQVSQIIASLVGNPEKLILPAKEDVPRPIRYSDIMVIVRTKKSTVSFMREFSGCGIPSMVEGMIEFKDCPALKTMAAVMEFMAAPTDAKTVYGILTSDLFGITDKHIASHISTVGKLSITSEKSKVTEVNEALGKLGGLCRLAYGKSPAAVFAIAMDELEIFRYVSTDLLEYLYFALELLRAAQIGGEVIGMKDAAVFIRELYSKSGQERCITLSRSTDRVHIANLHKVKGLEKPVVILAEPREIHHDPTQRDEHTENGDITRIFKVKGKSRIYAETAMFPEEQKAEGVSAEAEKLRLLYVAATRAANVLIVSEAVKISDGKRGNCIPHEQLLDFIDEEFPMPDAESISTSEILEERVPADKLYSQAGEDRKTDADWLKNKSYQLCRPSQIRLNTVSASENAQTDEPEKEPRTNAALMGTMVHKLMEWLVLSGKTGDYSGIISDILEKYGAGNEYMTMLMNVCKTLENGGYPQKNGMPADILAELSQAQEVGCEVPFCYMDNNGSEKILWNGVIDLIYKKDDKWRIVDYKTNEIGEGLDVKYSPQLEAYKKAFRLMTGEEADTFIYHIDI